MFLVGWLLPGCCAVIVFVWCLIGLFPWVGFGWFVFVSMFTLVWLVWRYGCVWVCAWFGLGLGLFYVGVWLFGLGVVC